MGKTPPNPLMNKEHTAARPWFDPFHARAEPVPLYRRMCVGHWEMKCWKTFPTRARPEE